MIFGSCHFLFCQRIQRDEANKIVADVDALLTMAAALVRRTDVNRLDSSMFLATI